MTSLSTGFAEALLAAGPHEQVPEEMRIFAPFIGSWQLVVSWFGEDGRLLRREDGEWHFAWVLEGRAIQDVWIVPPRAARPDASELYEYGTSLRFYDPAVGAWRSTWIGPMHGVVWTFLARRDGAEVVLETTPGTEPRMRWSFSDIAPEAFNWRNEIFEDGRWRVQQSFKCRRA